MIPGCRPQRDCCQNTQYHQNASSASVCSTHHSAVRPARRVSQLDRTANSTTNDIAWPRRRKSGNASRISPISSLNVDLVASIGVGPLRRTTSQYDGNSGQRLRPMSGYVDSSASSLSSPSRPASRSQVREHVELLSGSWQSENWPNNVQDTAALPDSPRAGSTAAQHGKAGPTGASAEIGRKTRDSPRSSRSGYWTHISGRSQDEDISRTATRTHRQLSDPFPVSNARTASGEGQKSQNRVFNFLCGLRRGRNQGDDDDGNTTSLQSVNTFLDSSGGMKRVQSNRTQLQTESHSSQGAPILSRPSSACSHISLASSIETIKSTLSFEVDLTQSEEQENVASPTSPPSSHFFTPSSLEEDIVYHPSALRQDDLNEGNREDNAPPGCASSSRSGNRGSARGARSPIEHMLSQFDHLYTGDNMQPISPQPAGSGRGFLTPTHLRTQNIRQSPAAPSASSPREVWPTSPLSHHSFELSSSTTSGLGLLTGVASPRCQPLPPSPAAQTVPESTVNRSVNSTDAQSPLRNTESSRNTPQQAHASSPHLSATTPEDMQSVRVRPIDYGSMSHLNVPLPPSPVSSASNSSARMQVQPGHRCSPRRSLYPSLDGEDPELLSPSGLDLVFGLPTPGLSPIQTPAVIRSPSMDPRSPVPSQMRIPGDTMGLLRAFLYSGHGLAHASFSFLSGLSFLVVLRLLRIIREWLPDYQGKR